MLKCKVVTPDTMLEIENYGNIEELTDCEIVRQNENDWKGQKRRMKNPLKKRRKKEKVCNEDNLNSQVQKDNDLDMSAWCNCFIPEPVLLALKDLGFYKPTPIQELAIPAAINNHQDILGAAETGSGKTLAFGIPIVNHIILAKEKELNNSVETNVLQGLVLTPTRELAIQVKKHLEAITRFTNIKIAVVVGGMSSEKQRRLLRKCPDLVVATPGRLWELIEEGETHLRDISVIRYLVIDEADRMVEKGHFQELTQILRLINGGNVKHKRQTFVFSATLSLVHDVPKRLAMKNRKGRILRKQKLESFIELIGMKENPKVIDITKKTGLVETLTESQITCSMEEKDIYLYYFLLMYPGRTIVFCNSIDCVRRLRNVFEYLNCDPLPLHASMHQRQRLKNLERFESHNTAVLLATDVAARGLDIKQIEHVIHFQVPRTAEIYVHRSGRTARAQSEGLSLMLIDPQDVMYYRKICKTLNKDRLLPSFPIDHNILRILKDRVTLVHTIDKLEHRMQRLMAQNRWFLNAAKDMDVEIDENEIINDIGDRKEYAAKCRQIKLMKKQLKLMLNKPIALKIHTGSYPTRSGKLETASATASEKAVKIMKNLNASELSQRKKRKK